MTPRHPPRDKLLYAALQLPWPPDNGQKIVTLNDLELLSDHFEIDLISFVDAQSRSAGTAHLKTLQERLPRINVLEPVPHDILRGGLLRDKVRPFLRSMARREPFVVSRYVNERYARTVIRLLEDGQYKVFYFESLGPSFVLPRLSPDVRRRTSTVYRAFDWFSETLTSYFRQLPFGAEKLAVGLDTVICRRYERALWSQVDLIVPVTARLAEQITRDAPHVASKLVHLPVVVNVPPPSSQSHGHTPPRVLYIGTVHYPPNLLGIQWFLRECWPRVIEQHPTAMLDIVGRGGERLGPVHRSVNIHNYVNDLGSVYGSACAFVVPLFAGSGIRLKILDAIAHRVPVVTTSIGYLGLDLTPGRDVLVADEPRRFAEHVCALLSNPTSRDTLAAQGQAFLRHHHGAESARRSVATIAGRLKGTG